ncbi:MAG TPA: TrkA C-terminal domain-containing protein [Spirochaetota bacterium]|nr:TrkA C-terminal domain-containing protein [Spirochaetota bacterium]
MTKNDVISLGSFGSQMATSLKDYGGDYMIMTIRPPKSFIGSSIRDLQIGARFQCQILCIRYLEGNDKWKAASPGWENMRIAPTANDIIPDNSELLFLGRKPDLLRIRKLG